MRVLFPGQRVRLFGHVLFALAAIFALAASGRAEASFFSRASIEALAPVVIFHHDEKFHPTSGKEFLDHSTLAFGQDDGCRPDVERVSPQNGRLNPWTDAEVTRLGSGGFVAHLRSPQSSGCQPLPGAENAFSTHDLTRPRQSDRDPRLGDTDGWYLDLAEDDRSGLPDLVAGDNRYQTAAPAYYDDGLLYTHDHYNGYAFVTFWFFYDYDDGPGPQNHEGDWEDVSIRLKPLGGNAWEPIEVFYAKHGYDKDVLPWDRAYKVSFQGQTRLGVFSALGTHASYGGGTNPLRFLDRIDKNGPTWATWKRLRFLWDQGWAGYCGGWGRIGEFSFSTGPLGAGCFNQEGHPVKRGGPAAWGTSQARTGAFSGGNTIVLAR